MKRLHTILMAALIFAWATLSQGESGATPSAYVVLDLAGGPDAKEIPVQFHDTLPAGFDSREYKTSKVILKWIAPGTFRMGGRNAAPRREVTLSEGFYIGIYEITQTQWTAVTGAESFHFKGNATHPAETVSWEDIRGAEEAHDWPAVKEPDPESFMGRLNARTGGEFAFDLPTEAQWEFACRAGTDTRWSFGDSFQGAADTSWSTDDSDDVTQEVGTKQPNPWGLYDMHGNVWEWCLDRFGTYPQEAETDPAGARSGWHRVWRGGGWDVSADLMRSAHRNGGQPSHRLFHVGFRLVATRR